MGYVEYHIGQVVTVPEMVVGRNGQSVPEATLFKVPEATLFKGLSQVLQYFVAISRIISAAGDGRCLFCPLGLMPSNSFVWNGWFPVDFGDHFTAGGIVGKVHVVQFDV